MRTLTELDIEHDYRITAHAAACIEQAELGESQGRANEAPRVRMLPRWLNQRSSVARMARTHGPAEGSDCA